MVIELEFVEDMLGLHRFYSTILYIVLLSSSSYSGYRDGKTIVLVRVLYLLYVYNKHVLLQVIYFFQLSAFQLVNTSNTCAC